MNKHQTYLLLGKILALDANPSNRNLIIGQLNQKEISSVRFVRVADHHLILQSLYPKLRDHKLLEYFPEELTEHLKYIFDLTTKRNLNIIKQTEKLTAVLRNSGITPLYMKGVGNILDGLYKYPGERILHDIDILVPEDSFEKSAGILLADGYQSNYEFDISKKSLFKHYPILYKAGEPIYVELHRSPVKSRHEKIFNTGIALEKAVHPGNRTDCLVMCDDHKIIHNFIHAQFDHNGRIYALEYMRNLYDLFLLSDRKDPETVFYEFSHSRRASSGYLDISYETFGNTPSLRKSPGMFLHSYRFRYFLNMRYRIVGAMSIFFIRVFLGYIVKPVKALKNPEIRFELIHKIKDPRWYKKQGDFYKKVFGISGKK